MKRLDHVIVEADIQGWSADIGYMSKDNTIVFEASLDGQSWVPINGQRTEGPGNVSASIVTNAVAGGPAKFRGSSHGVQFIRARLARHNGENISIKLTSGINIYDGVIGKQEVVMYVIDEESTIEDLLSG